MRPGHVSIIVGGSRGIGQAVARALAARGGNVFVIGRNRARVDDTVDSLTALGAGRHLGRVLDTSKPDDMADMAAICAQTFGGVDLLVFSAAVFGVEDDTKIPPQMLDLPYAAWRKALDVNLHGVFLANRAILPLMIERGQGEIINIGSALTPHGMRGRAHAAGYSATKFALAAFTQSLALELSEYGIRANVVFPGPISTPLIAGTPLAGPFRGQVSPEHFAQALLQLLELPTDCIPTGPYILPMQRAGKHQAMTG